MIEYFCVEDFFFIPCTLALDLYYYWFQGESSGEKIQLILLVVVRLFPECIGKHFILPLNMKT